MDILLYKVGVDSVYIPKSALRAFCHVVLGHNLETTKGQMLHSSALKMEARLDENTVDLNRVPLVWWRPSFIWNFNSKKKGKELFLL